MSWPTDPRHAKSLVALLREANSRRPARSKVSDGALGDKAHAKSGNASDHNPWVVGPDGVRVVTAVDITDDGDTFARLLADIIVKRRDPRVKYLIREGQICRSYAKPGIPAWTWSKYTGLNAHTTHLHVSVYPDPKLYDSEADWGIRRRTRVEEARALLRLALPNRPAEAQAKIRAALRELAGLQ